MSIKKSAVSEITFVGLDVHKDSITSAVLEPGRETPVVDRFFHDEASLRRFAAKLGDLREVRACYEAGPTGYEFARFLHRLGIACEVIAPSLIPVAPGAKVKTAVTPGVSPTSIAWASSSRSTFRHLARRRYATSHAPVPIS